jgi:hypothetical protein
LERELLQVEFLWRNILVNVHVENQKGGKKIILRRRMDIMEIDCEDWRRI